MHARELTAAVMVLVSVAVCGCKKSSAARPTPTDSDADVAVPLVARPTPAPSDSNSGASASTSSSSNDVAPLTFTNRFVAEDLLFEARLPASWKGVARAESAGFSRVEKFGNGSSERGVAFVSRLADKTLSEVKADWKRPQARNVNVEDRFVDGRPAIVMLAGDGELFLFVENKASDLLHFDLRLTSPFGPNMSRADADAFIATIRFLAPKVVPPNARFEVSGVVKVLEGNCMPPNPCPGRPLARTLVVQRTEPRAKNGERVMTSKSGSDGRYRVSLPPGAYEIAVLPDGEQKDASRAEARVLARVIDKPISADLVINHAVW